MNSNSSNASTLVQNTTAPVSTNVPILSFRISYLLSEITADIKRRMALALATLLSVSDPSTVILKFTAASTRRRVLLQQPGVLVDVGLLGFTGSVSQLASKVSLQGLNQQLAAQGLRPADSLTVAGSTLTPGETARCLGAECSMNSCTLAPKGPWKIKRLDDEMCEHW
jgi:hypothetical protein